MEGTRRLSSLPLPPARRDFLRLLEFDTHVSLIEYVAVLRTLSGKPAEPALAAQSPLGKLMATSTVEDEPR